MKNIDRIREMDIDELVKLFKNKCNMCSYNGLICGCELCTEGIKEWLNKEVISYEDILKEFKEEYIPFELDEIDLIDFVLHNFKIVDDKIERI